MSRETIEFKGEVFDLEEVNREAAHHLLDMIFQKQDEGEECDCARFDKVVMTDSGNMKRISYVVRVNIKVEDYV